VTQTPTAPAADRSAYAVFGALTGVASLLIVLQGLWAGIFLGQQYDDPSRDSGWVTVHSIGANVTLVVALVAVVWAAVKLRERRELLIGSIVLLVLLVIEQVLGMQIKDGGHHGLTAVHVPVAMLALALSVWLPLRARAGRAG
jgi:heme A synthase